MTFFKIGIQLLGGGYVIYPLLKKYLVENKKILTESQLVDYLSLSQCLPGIIALNISIFSGYALKKIKGAAAAVLGLILPSYLIILFVINFIGKFQDNKIFQNMFFGIRLSVIVLIFYMIYDIYKNSKKSPFYIFLYFFVLFCVIFIKLSPAVLIVISVLISLIYKGKK